MAAYHTPCSPSRCWNARIRMRGMLMPHEPKPVMRASVEVRPIPLRMAQWKRHTTEKIYAPASY